MDTQSVSVVDLLEQYPVFDGVVGYLGLRDLFALVYTSKRMCRVVQPLLRRVRQVDAALGGFFEKPALFRECLRVVPGVIVGDFAFAYFVGDSRVENQLDLVLVDEYVDDESSEWYDHYRSARLERFLQVEGYEKVNEDLAYGDDIWVCLYMVNVMFTDCFQCDIFWSDSKDRAIFVYKFFECDPQEVVRLGLSQRFAKDVSCVLTHEMAICDRIWNLRTKAQWQSIPHFDVPDGELRRLCGNSGARYEDVVAIPKYDGKCVPESEWLRLSCHG